MNNISLTTFVKRKKLEEEKEKYVKLPDKRRFKEQMTPEESIQRSILSEIENFGVTDPPRVLRIFQKIPHYQTLNITLLLIVYFYFISRNFDFSLVVENFDKDFNEQLEKIYEQDYFPVLEGRKMTAIEKYRFRQDFITYMLLINEAEVSETIQVGGGYEPTELTEITDGYENPFDVIGE